MFKLNIVHWLALAASLLCCACSSSVASLQTARALAPGQVQLSLGASLPVSTAAISGALDAADAVYDDLRAAEASDQPISAQTQKDLNKSALALALFQPSPVLEAGGRVGVIPKLDLGFLGSARQLKGDAKYQVWDSADGHAAALSLGYNYHLSIAPSVLESAFDLLEYVKLSDYARHDLGLSLIWSKDWGQWLSLYGSLRYLVSFISLDADLEKVQSQLGIERTSLNNRLHMLGLTGGAMIGYKHLFLHLELSVLNVDFAPTILGESVDLGGLLVAPTLGLTGRF